MRNEFAERFQYVLRGTCELNRNEEQVSAKRNGGMKGEKEKKVRV